MYTHNYYNCSNTRLIRGEVMNNQVNQTQKICSKCGRPLASGVSFCTTCGTPVPKQPVQTEQITFAFCTNCGGKYPIGNAFCTNCGQKITQSVTSIQSHIVNNMDQEQRAYEQAVRMFEEKKYDQALTIFNKLGEYSDSKLKAQECILQKENARKEQIYVSAVTKLTATNVTDLDLQKSIANLKSIEDYKDAANKIAELENKLQQNIEARENARKEQIYLGAVAMIKASKVSDADINKAIDGLKSILDYKDSANKIVELEARLKRYYEAKELARKDFMYNKAVALIITPTATDAQIKEAISIFKSLNGFKDAAQKAADTEARLEKIYKDREAAAEAERIRRVKVKKRRRKITTISIILIVLAALGTAGFIVGTTEHDIVYELDGGVFENESPDSYTILTEDIALGKPIKHGYTFVGWIEEEGDTPALDITIKKWSWGDKEYKAVWEANKYTITLNENGGESLDDLQVAYDSEFILPTPVWPGHMFNGWFLGTQRVESGICDLTNNVELIAKWDSITYDISYNLNGGVNLNNPYTYITDEEVILVAPIRAGYTFIGWTSEDQTTPVIDLTLPIGTIGNKNLTANWEANTYTLTFDADGGTLTSNTQTVTYDSAFDLPTPTKLGHTFAGWYNGNSRVTNGTWNYTENISLKARWNVNTYSITFDANGGTVDSPSMNVTYNTEFTLPTPTKTGHTFDGWYIGNVMMQDGTWSYTSNLILTAKWTPKTYSMTFDANGGTVDSTSMNVVYGSQYTLPTPTRTGYTFNGWYIGTTLVEAGTWNYTDNVTLVANWVVNQYNVTLGNTQYKESIVVTYDYNYGGITPTTLTLSSGDVLSYPTMPTRSGYVFTGWYTDSACTTRYNFNGSITNDMTLYAGWTDMSMNSMYSEYQIDPSQYDINASSYSVSTRYTYSSSKKHIYLVAQETGTHKIYYANSTSSSSYGYYLQIYNLTKGTTIRSNSYVSSTGYNNVEFTCDSGDIIVISIYRYSTSSSSYYSTAYFNFEGFNSITSSATVSYTGYIYNENDSFTGQIPYDSDVILPTPVRAGYTFAGWYNGTTLVENGKWIYANDVTLTPSWTPATYTLTLNANGGTVDSTTMNVTYGSEYTLPTPTRTGYTFNGWYEGTTLVESGTWTHTSDRTLTASWTANTYSLTLDANGGTVSNSSATVTYDSAFTVPTPTKTGYTFNGWYNGTTLVEAGTWNFATDVTLVATWTPNTYTLTFDANGGTGVDSTQTVTYNSEYTLPTPNKTGYTFSGWYNGTALVENGTWTTLQNVSLTARWTVNTYTLTLNDVYASSAISNNSSSPWTYSGGVLVSTNKSNNSTSEYIITAYRSMTISFRYKVSSESNYDRLLIYKNNTQLVNISGSTSYVSYSVNLNQGDTLKFAYSKDGSQSSGSDCAYIDDLVVDNDAVYTQGENLTSTITFGTSFVLPTPTRTGYTFNGWYNGATLVEAGTWNYDTDLTLVASWTPNTYTLTFDANGGTGVDSTQTVTYNSEYTLPTPNKTGYTFSGWYNGTTLVESGTWTGIENITLTANWTPLQYSITFGNAQLRDNVVVTYDYNYSGTTPTTVTLSNDDVLTYPAVPTRNGYVFTGWYTDSACTTKYSFTGYINDDMTLYAGWTEMSRPYVYNEYQIDPSLYTLSNPLTVSTSSTSSTSKNHIYLVAQEAGSHSIYYKNSSSTTNYRYNLEVYNLTKGTVVRSNSYISSTNYNYCNVTCEAGDVIVISIYRYSTSSSSYYSTASFYFSGFSAMTSTAQTLITALRYDDTLSYTTNVVYGSEFTLPTPNRTGYTFNGWYNGTTLITGGTWNYENNLTLTPSWTAIE